MAKGQPWLDMTDILNIIGCVSRVLKVPKPSAMLVVFAGQSRFAELTNQITTPLLVLHQRGPDYTQLAYLQYSSWI